MDNAKRLLLHTHRGAMYSTSVPVVWERSATGAGPGDRCLGRAADRRTDRERTDEGRSLPVASILQCPMLESGGGADDDAEAIDYDAANTQDTSCSQRICKFHEVN